MLTKEEMSKEFWLLTKGILQDTKIELDEARVIKRWLEEHPTGGDFTALLGKLDKSLADGWIDRFEGEQIATLIGDTLRILRT